jgi:hypothetical protein
MVFEFKRFLNSNKHVNRSSRRKRDMAFFIKPDFFLHFPNELSNTLGLKEMGNSFGKAGKKVCPVGCHSLVLIN